MTKRSPQPPERGAVDRPRKRFPSLLNCLGQSAAEYLMVCSCLIIVGLATPKLIDHMADTFSNKYRSYAFGVAISDPPTRAFDQKAQEIIQLIEKWGKKIIAWLEKFVTDIVKFFTQTIPDIFKWIQKQLDDLWALLKDPAKLLQKIKDVIDDILQQLLDFIIKIFEDIEKIVEKILTAIWDFIKGVAKAAWDILKKVLHYITHPADFFKDVLHLVLQMGEEVYKFLCGGK